MSLSDTFKTMLEATAFQKVVGKKKEMGKKLLSPDTFPGRFELHKKKNGLDEAKWTTPESRYEDTLSTNIKKF